MVGALLAIVFAAEVAWALNRSRSLSAGSGMSDRESTFSLPDIGYRLFHDHAFAFEATSILILVAMVGAVALAGRQLTNKKNASS
jgi:NADH:ubiquinone oxidoreductase subunit 6 (subunit J)